MKATNRDFGSVSDFLSDLSVDESSHDHSEIQCFWPEAERMIGERFGGLDDGVVSRDCKAIREKIETEPMIRKWFQDLVKLNT